MLYLIGLGLGDVDDITVKGLKIVKNAKRVYLEAYTSVLKADRAELESFYGREVILADRETVEQQSDEILKDAATDDVAFLVVGDPFGATTHTDLLLRAEHEGVPYKVVHNASIVNAIGCCGLQLYTFGEIVSIPFWTETWQPDSFYDKIVSNRLRGLHTLCLLDIKVKEQSVENLMKGRKVYEPPRFMTVAQAAEQLVKIVQRRREVKKEEEEKEKAAAAGQVLHLSPSTTLCIGVARVGHDDQRIVAASLSDMRAVDLGGPLHSLVVAAAAADLHPLEVDVVRLFARDRSRFDQLLIASTGGARETVDDVT